MKIRFCGVGGQGIVRSAYILGYAAMIDGYRVLQTHSYGSAYRGMLSKSDVIISNTPIYEFEFTYPDVFICLSERAYNAYKGSIHPEIKLFVDSDLVKIDTPLNSKYCLEASTLSCERFGDRIYANMILLGYMVSIVKPVSRESVEESINKNFPGGTSQVNLEAFQLGYNIGLDAE